MLSALHFFAATLDVAGTLLIGTAALRVHHRVLHDHRVDQRVFRVMRLEQQLGLLGLLLVSAGYVLLFWV